MTPTSSTHNPPWLVSIPEAASELGVHPDTIRRLIWKGELPVVRINRLVRIRHRDLVAFVSRNTSPSEPNPEAHRPGPADGMPVVRGRR